MVSFPCPTCSRTLELKEDQIGKRVRCPGCQKVVLVQLSAVSSPETITALTAGQILPEKKTEPPTSESATLPPRVLPPKVQEPQWPEDEGANELTSFLAPAQQPDELGRLGNYRILKILGHGGMGVVFLAEDTQLFRKVAIKAMLPDLAASASGRRRFLLEARAAAGLEHEHIVPIHDIGEDRGVPFFVMPFLHGEMLDNQLTRPEPWPVPAILKIGQQVAAALAFAHDHGLLHRDIKPANIWLEQRLSEGSSPPEAHEKGSPPGTEIHVRILDFGLARQVQAEEKDHLTKTGAILGTPGYMAPEQVNGEKPDGRTDLFSLGCVLYRLATGKAAFPGENMTGRLLAVLSLQPEPPARVNRNIPPALSDLILQLLAKQREERPANGQEVFQRLQAIEESLENETISQGVLGSAEDHPTPTLSQVQPSWKTRRWLNPRRILVATGLAVVLGGLLAGILVWRMDPWKQSIVESDDPTAKVALKKNGATLLDRPARKREEDLPPCAAENLKRESLSEATLAFLGQGDPKAAPPDLVAVLGDTRFRLSDIASFMAFSPDGKFLAIPDGIHIAIFEEASGRRVQYLQGHTNRVYALAYSPDGRLLASGSSDRTLRLWQTDSGKECLILPGFQDGCVKGLDFSPDNHWLAYVDTTRSIRLWDLASKKPGPVLAAPQAMVEGLSFNPDGRSLASLCADGAVRLWDVALGKLVATFPSSPSGWHQAVQFSKDGKMFARGGNNKLGLCNAQNGQVLWEKDIRGSFLAFHPDSRTLLSGDHYPPYATPVVKRWHLKDGEARGTITIKTKSDEYMIYALRPDGKALSGLGCNDRVVRFYSLEPSGPSESELGHAQQVDTVCFSPDGRFLASGSSDNTVRIWNLATGKQQHLLQGHTGPIGSVVFAPSSQVLASGSLDGTIILWDSNSGARICSIDNHCREPSQVAFSPDGQLVAAGTREGGVCFWLARTGEESRKLSGMHEGLVRCVKFSPDGRWLASGGADGKVVISELSTGKELHSFAHTAPVAALEFGPDQKIVVASYDGPESTVRLWNLANQEKVSFVGHADGVPGLAVRPDGKLLATGSLDGSVRLWELEGDHPRKLVLGSNCFGKKVGQVAFSGDGRYLATGNGNGLIYLFRLPPLKEKISAWMEARDSSPPPGLGQEEWLKRVKGLSGQNLAQAISDRFIELNPGIQSGIGYTLQGNTLVTVRTPPGATDISPLQACPSLKEAHLWGPNVSDLSILKGMSLTALDCAGNPISDLSPLEGMPLQRANFWTMKVQSLSPLKGMPLTFLNCGANPITDLSPLKGLPLNDLAFPWTQVKDLSPLKGMPLKFLDFHHTPVTSLAPLEGMSLNYLCCSDTKVADLSPLKGTLLRTLICHNTSITDFTPLQKMPLQELRCDFVPERDADILRSIKTLEKINEKPAQDFWKEVDEKFPPRKR